jgi:hypothetical protein
MESYFNQQDPVKLLVLIHNDILARLSSFKFTVKYRPTRKTVIILLKLVLLKLVWLKHDLLKLILLKHILKHPSLH